ncbi:MAG TPA: SHOCT domain-containing protein [Patescibacteria group bacterium]
MMYGYYPHMGYLGYGFGLGWIFMLIFWILVIWAIIALVRGFSGGHWHDRHCTHCGEGMEDSAMKTLRERYAKGEINKEEFESKKKDLMGKTE